MRLVAFLNFKFIPLIMPKKLKIGSAAASIQGNRCPGKIAGAG